MKDFIYPQSNLSDIPLLKLNEKNENTFINFENFKFILSNFMKNIKYYEVNWVNGLNERGSLFYKLLKYFLMLPSHSFNIFPNKKNLFSQTEKWKLIQKFQVFNFF
jgi:hypothetical protein